MEFRDFVECSTLVLKLSGKNLLSVQYNPACHLQAHRQGQVDAFVQSTDKNFMVPVGGSIVASSSPDFIKQVSQIYPGMPYT